MASPVKPQTATQVMISWVHGFEPPIGLCTDSSEPGACFRFCMCLFLCPCLLALCLSLKNKYIYIKKRNTKSEISQREKGGTGLGKGEGHSGRVTQTLGAVPAPVASLQSILWTIILPPRKTAVDKGTSPSLT